MENTEKTLNDSITITKDRFMSAIARTMAEGKIKELIKELPAMILVISAFGAELTRELFDKEEKVDD